MRGRIFGEGLKTTGEDLPAQSERKEILHSRAKSFTTNITPSFALQDPCIHALDRSSKFYLDYCALIHSYFNVPVGALMSDKR